MIENLSNFVWLEPTESCTAASTAKRLLRWCKTLEVPVVWVSDTALHLKNHVMKTLEEPLRVRSTDLRCLIRSGRTTHVSGRCVRWCPR